MHSPAAFVLALACLATLGCSSEATRRDSGATGRPEASSRPPIRDQSTALREPESAYREVVPGDTLYSIAWESGRDYRELAKWNRIPPPYLIKPGQRLRVKPPAAAEQSTGKASPARARTATPVAGAAKPAPKTSGGTGPASVASGKPQPAEKTKSGKSKPANTTAQSSSQPPPARPAQRGSVSGGWAWPTDGKLLNRYSEVESKGLDIGGTRGSPVRAAASGRVVYEGSGLRGYGQLIIIKHNDEFLSAYAHNDRIHVKEGEVVKRGQKIADMGSTGTDRNKLHFEIRRQGIPVDPLKYLPKR